MDINCDLGEGEPLELTEALMQHITSANIGSEKREECIALAQRYGVHVGAHPRHPIGRGDINVSVGEFEELLRKQVGQFSDLHHIKLHGALYHATEKSEMLGKCYVELVKREWPGVIIYAQCGKRVQRIALQHGILVWGEVFADRRYSDQMTLVPRSEARALITDPEEAVSHAKGLVWQLRRAGLETGVTVGGGGRWSSPALSVGPQTLCVHSDTPNAVAIAEALRRMVRESRPSSRE